MHTHSVVAILDSIDRAVFVMDQGYVLVYVNQAFAHVTGHSTQSALGSKCYELLGTPQCANRCPVNKILSGQSGQETMSCDFIKKIRIKGGLKQSFRASVAPAWHQGQLLAVTILTPDITPLRKPQDYNIKTRQQLLRELYFYQEMEASLRRSEALYRAMFEHTGTAMLVINEDRTIAMANKELEHMTGYTSEQIASKATWDKFVHPDDKAKMIHYHNMRREKKDAAPQNYEFRLIHASGEVLNIFFTVGMIPGSQQSIGSMINITQRKQMEQALRESEEKYRLLLENIEDVFYEVDINGNFTFINAAVEWVFGGFTKDELIGRNFREIVDKENSLKVYAAYNKVYTTGVPERGFTWTVLRPDGQRREAEVSISPIRNEQNHIIGFRGTARDITERKQMENRLRYLSLHDSLTGLYNRAYLEEEIERLRKGREFPVSIICGDIDDLKIVNDTMGHKKGDELLIAAARALQQAVRKSDVLARVGGDEFVIVLPKTSAANVTKIYCRICESIAQINKLNPTLSLSISLGWATIRDGEDIMDTYKRADNNMYKAKHRKLK